MGERILYGRDEDLGYNQSGQLSPRQAELTARPLRWAALSVVLGGVICLLLAIGLPLLLKLEGSTAMLLSGLLAVAALTDMGVGWFMWRRAAAAGNRPLEVVEGRLEQLPGTPGGALPRQIALGGRMITVPMARLPLRPGASYRAYGLPIAGRNVLMTYTLTETEDFE